MTADKQGGSDRGSASAGSSHNPGRPRKRRRWLRRLIVVVVVLVGLLVAAPHVLSSAWGTNLVTSMVNGRIKGRIELGDLSISWLGPISARGLKVLDPEGRSVLEVESVQCAPGLIGAARSWEDFGRVEVRSPRAVLYLDAKGQPSLARALEPVGAAAPGRRQPEKREKPEKQPAEPPDLRGGLLLTGGSVRVVQPEGRSYTVEDIRVQCDVATLNDLRAQFSCALQGGGKIEAEAAVKDLLRGAGADGKSASATLSVKTPSEIDLAPIGAFANRPEVGGKLGLTVSGNYDADRMKGDAVLAVTGLRAAARRQDQPEPVDLKLTVEASGTPEKQSGSAELAGGAGSLKITGGYVPQPGRKLPTPEQVLAAILDGKPVELPQVEVTADGKLDVARLAKAVPSLLNVRPDVQVTGCVLSVDGLALQGGARPRLTGQIALKDLAAVQAGKAVRWEPMTVDLSVLTDEGGALKIDKASVASAFATLRASGTVAKADLSADVDLDGMHKQLGQVLDFSGFALSGRLKATAAAERTQTAPITLKIDLDAEAVDATYAPTGPDGGAALALAGKFELHPVVVRKPGEIRSDGMLQARGIRLTAGKRQVRQDVVTVEYDASFLDEKADLDLRRLKLTSAPVTLELKGTAKDLRGAAQVDVSGKVELDWAALTPLIQQLAADAPKTLAELGRMSGSFGLAGSARQSSGTFELKGPVGDVATQFAFKAAQPGKAVDVAEVLDGLLAGKPVGLPDVNVEKTHLNVNIPLLARAMPEWLGLRKDVQVTGGQLAIPDLQVRGGDDPLLRANVRLEGIAGSRAGQAFRLQPVTVLLSARRNAAGVLAIDQGTVTAAFAQGKVSGPLSELNGEFRANLDLLARQLESVVDFKAVLGGELRADFTVARPAGNAKRLDVGLTVTADKASYGPPPGKPAKGAAAPSFLDLFASTPPEERPGRQAGPTVVSGKAECKATVTLAEVIGIDGTTRVTGLAVALGKETFRQDSITVVHKLGLDSRRGALTVSKLDVSSEPHVLSLHLSGAVTDWQGDSALDFKGDYTGSWDRIKILVEALSPEAMEQVALAGETVGDIVVGGSLRKPKITFPTLAGNTALGWDSGEVYGLQLGKAVLKPQMADGQAVLPLTEFTASQGTMRLAGTVDFRGAEPVLKMPGHLPVLENVRLNRDFSRAVLSRVNPIFSDLVSIDGTVSLALDDVDLPLGETLTKGGKGKGSLQFGDLKVQPGGLLQTILQAAGVKGAERIAMSISGVDFEIRDGGLVYKDMTVTFADKLSLAFSGQVKFDDSIDLMVSVPVTAGLLQQVGVRGDAARYAGFLEGVRVGVPIVGTKLKPRVDFSKVNAKSLVDQAVKNMAAKGIGGILEGILPPKKDEPKEPKDPKQKQPTTKPAEKLIGDVLDLLGKPKNKKKKGSPKGDEQPATKPAEKLIGDLFDLMKKRQE